MDPWTFIGWIVVVLAVIIAALFVALAVAATVAVIVEDVRKRRREHAGRILRQKFNQGPSE